MDLSGSYQVAVENFTAAPHQKFKKKTGIRAWPGSGNPGAVARPHLQRRRRPRDGLRPHEDHLGRRGVSNPDASSETAGRAGGLRQRGTSRGLYIPILSPRHCRLPSRHTPRLARSELPRILKQGPQQGPVLAHEVWAWHAPTIQGIVFCPTVHVVAHCLV